MSETTRGASVAAMASSGDLAEEHDTQEYVTDLVAKKLVESMQKDTTRYFDSVWQVRLISLSSHRGITRTRQHGPGVPSASHGLTPRRFPSRNSCRTTHSA